MSLNSMSNLKLRIGHSYDLHQLIPGTGLMLGNVFFPWTKQVRAESDGDVILHTISEAIIGALGLGDLGCYFTKQNAPSSSIVILNKTLALMLDQHYQINNLDTLVVLDDLMLKPMRDQIIARLVQLLKINPNQINFKATTTESTNPNVIQAYSTILLTQQESVKGDV